MINPTNVTVLNNVRISKGYNGAEAISANDTGTVASFKISWSVFDSREEDNVRWINKNCKCFEDVYSRIRRMKLKAGSVVNIVGSLDEEVYEDKEGRTRHKDVIIVESISFGVSMPKDTKTSKAAGKSAGKTTKKPSKTIDNEACEGEEDLDSIFCKEPEVKIPFDL